MPELVGEAPLKIHQQHALAADGTPALTGQFADWLMRGKRRSPKDPSDELLRLRRAMRILRTVAPREHDVTWRVLRGEGVMEIHRWLNERAETQGHPERYTPKDVVVLIVSGVDKLAFWY